MEYMMSVMDLEPDSQVDGEGVRAVLFCAGCNFRCENCFNSKTWDVNNGMSVSVQEIFDMLMYHPDFSHTTGVTYSGGEPMLQAEALCELTKMIKNNSQYDIWCYTGYLFEDMVGSQGETYELLKMIDVLVDGQYVQKLRDPTLIYRGSSNQRIIDVQESLKQNTVVERAIKSSPRKTRKFMI